MKGQGEIIITILGYVIALIIGLAFANAVWQQSQCQKDLPACQSNLSICDQEKANISKELGTCGDNLQACNTSLTACNTSLAATGNEPTAAASPTTVFVIVFVTAGVGFSVYFLFMIHLFGVELGKEWGFLMALVFAAIVALISILIEHLIFG
ncbi:MAG: hypothetical protein V1887_03685 [Candidatus Aenigmatarchaeota archaeon]